MSCCVVNFYPFDVISVGVDVVDINIVLVTGVQNAAAVYKFGVLHHGLAVGNIAAQNPHFVT